MPVHFREHLKLEYGTWHFTCLKLGPQWLLILNTWHLPAVLFTSGWWLSSRADESDWVVILSQDLGKMVILSAGDALYPFNMKRTPGIHCWTRGAIQPWWCCCTQQASVRTSGGCAKSMTSSHLDCHSAQCWPRSRTFYQWRNGPRSCTTFPAAGAGPTHHQMEEDHNGWHGQTPQWAVTQGSHPRPHDPPPKTATQDLSSLDTGWLTSEDRKAEPTRQVQHLLMYLVQTPVTANRCSVQSKERRGPVTCCFAMKTRASSTRFYPHF